MKVLFVVLACLAVARSSDDKIDYTGQSDWGGVCTSQESLAQSPIDVIEPADATVLKVLIDLPESAKTAAVENADNVNSLKFSFTDADFEWESKSEAIPMTVTIAQLHLHWGAEDSDGSEHAIDGDKFSAECHLVTTYTEDDTTKYAVFARVFKVGDANAIIQSMITDQDSGAALTELDLTALYPDTIEKVLTYAGSLTTPACTETVSWFVVAEPLTISTEQLAALRVLKLGGGEDDAVTFNWRSLQQLESRTIKCYELDEEDDEEDDEDDDSSAVASYLGALLLAPVLTILL